MARLRVGFAGTPPFAAQSLRAILGAGFDVPLVLTQPDRPSGRGLNVQPSAVKTVAVEHAIEVLQPASLKSEADRAPVLARALDVLVVAAYGLILPPAVLAWPRHGGLNVHASLLPRWRGAAPIQHAILAGDAETGISIMQMDAGLDTGAVIDTHVIAIAPRETTGTLTDKLSTEGARAIVEALHRLEADGTLASVAQPAEGATYAAKIDRRQAELDWRDSAAELGRRVRAFDPAPGAYTTFTGVQVKVWDGEPVAAEATAPGTVLAVDDEAIVVGCGDGALRVRAVQPAGGKRMSAASYAAGRKLTVGARFGASP